MVFDFDLTIFDGVEAHADLFLGTSYQAHQRQFNLKITIRFFLPLLSRPLESSNFRIKGMCLLLKLAFSYRIIIIISSSSIDGPERTGPLAQSVVRLTQEPEVPGSIPVPATYFRFSFR